MPGNNHYPNCTCGWCRGGGGWGSPTRVPNPPLPAAGTRSALDGDGCCCPTTCPMCGASVYFVRHNGGSVWFDNLGKPWPKHTCFFDDGFGLQLRTRLTHPSEGTIVSLFGVVIETVVTKPGEAGRIVVQCSDGKVIDTEFNTKSNLTTYPGSLVVVEESEMGRYQLHRIKGNNRIVEVWNCMKLDQILVFDPEAQGGVEKVDSRFWVWNEKRWTLIRDFNVQRLLVPLDGQEATRIALEYTQNRPVSPQPRSKIETLMAIINGRNSRRVASIKAKIFAGTPREQHYMLPGSLTREQVAEWVKEVETLRRSYSSAGQANETSSPEVELLADVPNGNQDGNSSQSSD